MKKKRIKRLLIAAAVTGIFAAAGSYMFAKEASDDVIADGVSIGGIDVSGMTKEEAKAVVEDYVSQIAQGNVVFMVADQPVAVSASALGVSVQTQDIYDEVADLGKKGNVIKRYKDNCRLEKKGMNYQLQLSFDEAAVRSVIENQCRAFDRAAQNAGLKRTGNGFEVTAGVVGQQLDVEQSVQTAMQFLREQWNVQNTTVALVVNQTQPKGTAEELAKVKDLLATATTSYSTSGANRCGNVERGASLINGTVLYPGEEFSTYQTVSPITVENGYFMAASYAEGQVVESPGGGICQVSTTLYNAVLKAELDVTQRANHSMIVTYVDPAKDAAIAGTYKDFKFVNNTQAPVYIEGITSGKKITFNIYGMETRSASRSVEYVSETIEETEPVTQITADGAANFGSITSESAHKGVVAKLWKVVKENNVEVSRTEVNKSKYAMTPKKYVVGLANASAEAAAEMQAAIASQDINVVKAVIGKYGSVPANAAPATDPDTMAEGSVAGDAGQQPAAGNQQPDIGTQPQQPDTGAQQQPDAGSQPQPQTPAQ